MRRFFKQRGRPVWIAVVTILLASCQSSATTFSQSSSSSTRTARSEVVTLPTGAPTLEASPTSTRVIPLDSLTPSPTPTVTPIPDEVRGLVVEVIDGDTIAVVLEGDSPRQAYEVKYLGIEAPPNISSNPWGTVAFEANRKMTNLKVVRLVRDETDLDDEGRLLRYVYVNDELLSIILTEQGLAEAAPDGTDTRFEAEIADAETRAREGRLGLWTGTTPTSTPTRLPSVDGGTEQSDTIGPDETPRVTAIPPETIEAEATVEEEVEDADAEMTPTPTLTTTLSATLETSPTPTTSSTTVVTPTATATGSADTPENEADLQGPQ